MRELRSLTDLAESGARLPARHRMATGVAIISLVLIADLHGIILAGTIWLPSLFGLFVGGVVLFYAIADRKTELRLQYELSLIQQNGMEIVDRVVRIRKGGGNAIAYLEKQGFTLPQTRQFLLREATRWASDGDPPAA